MKYLKIPGLPPTPMSWKQDGVDHINIWQCAESDVGRAMSHGYRRPFTHAIFGKFNSMEAFWYYLQSSERDPKIMDLFGYNLKKYVRENPKGFTTRKVLNFKAVIMESNYRRIMEYDGIIEELKNSTLPFDLYYIMPDGTRLRPKTHNWLIPGWLEIRNALQENREPDFTFLLDRAGSDIYAFVKEDEERPAFKSTQLNDMLRKYLLLAIKTET